MTDIAGAFCWLIVIEAVDVKMETWLLNRKCVKIMNDFSLKTKRYKDFWINFAFE